jgi:hypothetical protein
LKENDLIWQTGTMLIYKLADAPHCWFQSEYKSSSHVAQNNLQSQNNGFIVLIFTSSQTLGLSPSPVLGDSWWIKWQWGRSLSEYFIFPVSTIP